MFMCWRQNARINHRIKVANKSFKVVARHECFGVTTTNQDCIHKEIRSGLISREGCYHTVQNFLSFILLSTNIKIKIYKTVILSAVFYGRESWSDILQEQHVFGMF